MRSMFSISVLFGLFDLFGLFGLLCLLCSVLFSSPLNRHSSSPGVKNCRRKERKERKEQNKACKLADANLSPKEIRSTRIAIALAIALALTLALTLTLMAAGYGRWIGGEAQHETTESRRGRGRGQDLDMNVNWNWNWNWIPESSGVFLYIPDPPPSAHPNLVCSFRHIVVASTSASVVASLSSRSFFPSLFFLSPSPYPYTQSLRFVDQHTSASSGRW